MTTKYAKQDYVIHERIECEFEDDADMKFWSLKMRAKGYQVSEITGMAVGPHCGAIATRNRVRKTFEF